MNSLTIEITDISAEGEGIGKIDGKVYFVPYALPGETAEIEVVEDKGRFAKARRIDKNTRGLCGGCPLLGLDYAKQLAWKKKHVTDCIERIGKISSPNIAPIIGMDDPYGYRNKCEFMVGAEKPLCNVYCEDCPIQNEQTKEIVRAFRENPTKNASEFVVRTSKTGEHLAFTIQDSGYVLLYSGKKVIKDYIETDMGKLYVEVDPYSFYQVNSYQTGRLYSVVQKYADLNGTETVLDLYCGAGTIGLSMASGAARVIGVESVKPAVIAANRNAVINGIVNAMFICGKAENAVSEKLQGINADVVIVDPPRAGCKPQLLKTVADIDPKKLIYVSCNPATLARDLKILAGCGFKLVEATPVDMFPHTAHVETVVLLRREKPDAYIDLDVNIEDLYNFNAGQASYG